MEAPAARKHLVETAKEILKRTVYRPDTIARVLYGPLRGHRFMLRETPNWASILGRWEPDAARVYTALIKTGHVVYDCGANVGMHTLHFSKLVGPNGQVFAFDPLPVAARDIALNCALNNIQNVTVVERALAEGPGKATFKLGPHTTQGSLAGLTSGAECRELTVTVTSLDAMIADGAAAPDFLKMDIEGAEGAALDGFSEVIRSYPTFSIDLHTPAQDLKVGAFLSQHGYAVYRVGDDVARRALGQREVLRPIPSLDKGWPRPDGVWGTVVAIHPTRDDGTAAALCRTIAR